MVFIVSNRHRNIRDKKKSVTASWKYSNLCLQSKPRYSYICFTLVFSAWSRSVLVFIISKVKEKSNSETTKWYWIFKEQGLLYLIHHEDRMGYFYFILLLWFMYVFTYTPLLSLSRIWRFEQEMHCYLCFLMKKHGWDR